MFLTRYSRSLNQSRLRVRSWKETRVNYLEIYEVGKGILASAGIDSPDTDAFYLMQHVFHINRGQLLVDPLKKAEPALGRAYLDLIRKRSERIPCQYLIGSTEFMGLTFKVNPSVLIPRQDTETLVEEVIRIIPSEAKVLDMCTGSGCIGISVKCFLHNVDMTLSDISEEALRVAEENAELQGVEVRTVCSDLFENIDGRFDVILSNPPYVTDEEYASLMPEVRDYEPRLALTAGQDGLDIYRRIAKEVPSHLNAEGWLIMEIGCSQADAVRALLEAEGFEDIRIVKDLAGLDRVVVSRLYR
ncbi:MAG: peptide chain release factor N(5)-glutamine methyltransferase [Lachnospiraceae bacterium]|nr:peptide chain release factor N(5)-glutamine methyltransferase [Lachnospiraceae bacterium]